MEENFSEEEDNNVNIYNNEKKQKQIYLENIKEGLKQKSIDTFKNNKEELQSNTEMNSKKQIKIYLENIKEEFEETSINIIKNKNKEKKKNHVIYNEINKTKKTLEKEKIKEVVKNDESEIVNDLLQKATAKTNEIKEYNKLSALKLYQMNKINFYNFLRQTKNKLYVDRNPLYFLVNHAADANFAFNDKEVKNGSKIFCISKNDMNFSKYDKLYLNTYSTNNYTKKSFNYEINDIKNKKLEKIIIIQKYFRGFIFRKKIRDRINKIILLKIINSIILIQRKFRQYNNIKNKYKYKIIDRIINERKNNAKIISNNLLIYNKKCCIKKNEFINKVIKARNESAIKIQRFYRNYKLGNVDSDYLIFFLSSKINISNRDNFYIKIYMNKNIAKLYKFTYCPKRDIYIANLPKTEINPDKYLCQFLIKDYDNFITFNDNDLPSVIDNDGTIYNIIKIYDKYIPKKLSISDNGFNLPKNVPFNKRVVDKNVFLETDTSKNSSNYE